MGKIKYIILSFLIILISGCDKKSSEIKLAANEWIGYAPLFYLKETKQLDKYNIKLIRTVSLGESLNLYKSGLVQGLASTQYEFMQIDKYVSPILLFDKSYGADMILSNKTIKELKSTKHIKAYLEINSVNYLLLQYFLKKFNISMKNIDIVNMDQEQMRTNKYNMKKSIIIVTYSPYDIDYIKNGFKTIDSTKKDRNLLVIDALFIDNSLLNDKRFKKLKKEIKKVIVKIKNNPKSIYKVIKNYYPGYSYKDFLIAIKNIKWINKSNKEILKDLNQIDFPIKELK